LNIQRAERVRSLLKKEVSDIVQNHFKDPRIGFVTVTDVEISVDLRHAKVFVSIMGDEDSKKSTVTALEKGAGFIRTEIGKRIRLRHTPELLFRIDNSLEYGAKINDLLKQIREQEKDGDNN
jgi:ribosome-binding factor A